MSKTRGVIFKSRRPNAKILAYQLLSLFLISCWTYSKRDSFELSFFLTAAQLSCEGLLNLRMFILGFYLLSFPLSAYSGAESCIDLFDARVIVRGRPRMVQTTVNQVFITQESIGLYYARVKMAEKTDVDLEDIIKLNSLNPKAKAKIKEYAQDSLHEEVFPAVLSPDGKVFIVDGHHNLYMAVLAGLDLSTASIQLRIIRDYTGKSEEFFMDDLIKNHLVYGDAKSLLQHPQHIDSVKNSPERSLVGLAFMRIARKYDIPFKGAFFKPFVQFDLADIIRKKRLFSFHDDYSNDNIKALASIIVHHHDLLKFLIDSLNSDAPDKTKEFLNDQLAE